MSLKKMLGRMPQPELVREVLGIPDRKRVCLSIVDRAGPDAPQCQVCQGDLGDRNLMVPMRFGRPNGGTVFVFVPTCGAECEEKLRDGSWEDQR